VLINGENLATKLQVGNADQGAFASPRSANGAIAMLPPIMRELPSLAPMFAEQRLVVFQMLERWQQRGWLVGQGVVN
jgi:hypothetical protein